MKKLAVVLITILALPLFCGCVKEKEEETVVNEVQEKEEEVYYTIEKIDENLFYVHAMGHKEEQLLDGIKAIAKHHKIINIIPYIGRASMSAETIGYYVFVDREIDEKR